MELEWQKNLDIGSHTHIGRRIENQDFSIMNDCEKGLLMVVCDGMGGASGGSRASRLCASIVGDFFESMDFEIIQDFLIKSIQKANTLIYEEAQNNPSLEGMGTTCVIAVINDSTLHYANVGDSRLYLIKSDYIVQLTKDHSLVQKLIDEGKLVEEDASNYPNRHIITRAVGVSQDVEVDTGMLTRKLTAGDAVLLCTDGLSGILDASTIFQIIVDESPQEACEKLVNLAYDSGGADNITAQIAKFIETNAD